SEIRRRLFQSGQRPPRFRRQGGRHRRLPADAHAQQKFQAGGRDAGAGENQALAFHFIGQIASAIAADWGEMVTNFLPTYCNSTGSASLFWPVSSNLMRFQGMMVCSPGISVAASASR